MTRKPEFCSGCPLNYLTSGYVPPIIKPKSILLVGEEPAEGDVKAGVPFGGGAGQWVNNLLRCARIKRDECSVVNTIGCYPGDGFPGDKKWTATSRDVAHAGVEYCGKHHLWPAVNTAKPGKIIAFGEHALTALTPRSGITIWRGSPLPLKGRFEEGPKVIPTLAPWQLMRQAKLFSVVIGDLQKSCVLPPERYNLWPTLEDVKAFRSTEFAFDFEWDSYGNVTLCGLSDRFYSALVVPFTGSYVGELRRIFENATALIGHNIIGADMKWLEKWGWDVSKARLEDTMLKQHLVQPDYPHDLGFVASVFSNKVFWKGKGKEEEDFDGNVILNNVQWRTWDQPNALPRKVGGYGGCVSAEEAYRLYNARDDDGEFQINLPLDRQLVKYKMEDVYRHVSVPTALICRRLSEHGLRIDRSRLGEVREMLDEKIAELEQQLPEGLKPYEEEVGCNLPAPPGTYKAKEKKCKGSKKDGTAHPSVGIIFTSLQDLPCPTCGKVISPGKMSTLKIIKGTKKEWVVPYTSAQQVAKYAAAVGCKEVLNRETGRITTGNSARKRWAVEHPEFTILGNLKENVTLRTNFAKDSLLTEDWMYFSLKVHGTGEGRLSSVGQRKGIDLNIQNQPEDFRIIYIPDEPGQGILNIDISQGESQLTTWLAKDWPRWERIQDPAYDEHSELAERIFGFTINKQMAKPGFWGKLHPEWSDFQCRSEARRYDAFRQVGKKINHGRNYGMGIRKQREILLEEGYVYTENDIREFIEIWKKLNAGTAKWQTETIAIAEKQGYLENPFGRRRWFQSRDFATKALAFLPASTLADMVLRMMIAHFPDDPRIWESISHLRLKRYAELVEGWRMAIQVHDSLVFIGPDGTWKEQATRSKEIMTMPWDELEGFAFRVDAKYGTKSWGECKGVEI
jgi:uracil-DNA glycosylase family 4